MQPTPAHVALAQSYLADAIAHGTRWGTDKVFLSTVPGIDLADAECLAQLTELRLMGLLTFARADLVGAMDPALVKASCWGQRFGGLVFESHFLVVG